MKTPQMIRRSVSLVLLLGAGLLLPAKPVLAAPVAFLVNGLVMQLLAVQAVNGAW